MSNRTKAAARARQRKCRALKKDRLFRQQRKELQQKKLFCKNEAIGLKSRCCYDNKVQRINATQSTTLQVIPHVFQPKPNAKGGYNKGDVKLKQEYPTMTEREQLDVVLKRMQKSVNGNNQGQRAKGFGYCGKKIKEDSNILIVDKNATIYIKNEMANSKGECYSIEVRYLKTTGKDGQITKELIESAHRIGERWTKEADRGNKCPRGVLGGAMKHFGEKRGAGDEKAFYYGPTKGDIDNKKSWRGQNEDHANLNRAAKKIARVHFKGAYKDIKQMMKVLKKNIPKYLGGKDGLCSEFVQSQRGLVTEFHVDLDLTKCVSFWSLTVNEGGNANTEGWYFVLPFLTGKYYRKQYAGIAIKLEHGVGIEWDGREIFHCSTAPLNKSINVYGNFFGITKNGI